METKLYVGNLSYDSTQQDIEALFEPYGVVSDVFIVKDRESGRPRGFAFVTMETEESMHAAVKALNGKEFMGRELAINEARPREERGRDRDQSGGKRGGFDNNRKNNNRGFKNRRD